MLLSKTIDQKQTAPCLGGTSKKEKRSVVVWSRRLDNTTRPHVLPAVCLCARFARGAAGFTGGTPIIGRIGGIGGRLPTGDLFGFL